MKTGVVHVKKLAIVSIFAALAVALSPFTTFIIFGTNANPTQHLINAILGVFVGPLWAVVAAVVVGAARNLLGAGTLFAFPGGMPGGLVVGSAYWILKRLRRSERTRLMSALTEPLGTLLIGAPIALFLLAPSLGALGQPLVSLMSREGMYMAFLIFTGGWALSCIPGSIIALIVLLVLNRVGLSRETLFGEE
jgi:energy coupling factor transporter S component ThiW